MTPNSLGFITTELRLVCTDLYIVLYVFIVDQTEDLLKYWHEVMTFVNTKDGFHLYISFYSYLCQRVFSATGIITKP